MAIKKYKPTSPGRRGMSTQDFGDITTHEPEKSLLAALVGDKSDKRRAVRIIFQPLDGRRDVPHAALEVDDAIALLVTASDSA